jgi:hypothetical protein
MPFYSQCGEDRWIEENLKPDVGVFCEVGAFDGVISSNTKHFEEIGWTGVLVEADPYLAAKCRENRTALTWCCASGIPHTGAFFINEQDRGLSGFNRPGRPNPTVCVPLKILLLSLGHFSVDLLSIDTEGTELDVWNSIGPIRPGIVIMEHQTCQEPSNLEPILARMIEDGYYEAHRTQYNLIFTK